ncbi:MAG: hypothetical protein P8Y14_13825 [Anaerolineales bacterium]
METPGVFGCAARRIGMRRLQLELWMRRLQGLACEDAVVTHQVGWGKREKAVQRA